MLHGVPLKLNQMHWNQHKLPYSSTFKSIPHLRQLLFPMHNLLKVKFSHKHEQNTDKPSQNVSDCVFKKDDLHKTASEPRCSVQARGLFLAVLRSHSSFINMVLILHFYRLTAPWRPRNKRPPQTVLFTISNHRYWLGYTLHRKVSKQSRTCNHRTTFTCAPRGAWVFRACKIRSYLQKKKGKKKLAYV